MDAIVTDPPYGIREVSQVGYCAGALFGDLLQLAAERLPLGGRLVYWLPVTRSEYAPDRLPGHSCLRLVANSEQLLTSRASRPPDHNGEVPRTYRGRAGQLRLHGSPQHGQLQGALLQPTGRAGRAEGGEWDGEWSGRYGGRR